MSKIPAEANSISLTDPVLLVVDMQNDFCKPGYSYSKEQRDLDAIGQAVQNTGNFLSRYRTSGRAPILVRTTHDERTNSQVMNEKYENRRMPCRTGTAGAEFVEELNVRPTDVKVTKHRYSAFYGTDLETYLSSNNISRLLIAGVATGVCVESTVRDAFDRNYDVTLLTDCAGSTDPDAHTHTVEKVDTFFGSTAESSDIDLEPVT